MFLFVFSIKNVLVPWTSYVKGLRVRTQFLPVADNRTYVLAHPVIRQSLQASDNSLETPRYHYDFSLTARPVLTSLTAE